MITREHIGRVDGGVWNTYVEGLMKYYCGSLLYSPP